MDTNKIILLIDNVIDETLNYAKKYCKGDVSCVASTRKVLLLLRGQIESSSGDIDELVLMAMHDVGMSSYKEFENTPLEQAINDVTNWLYSNVPRYKELRPLGQDFEAWVNGGNASK